MEVELELFSIMISEQDTVEIDADYAVTCLDGDGCKIRSGSVTNEDISTLDTSIACDSCDLWFHAFCVGFDPEGADVDSWLCPTPRCLVGGTGTNSDLKGKCVIQNELDPGSGDPFLVDTSSGKVSISVADDGETAVVVSRIGGEHFAQEPIPNGCSETELSNLVLDSLQLEMKEIKVTQLEATLPESLFVSVDQNEPITSSSGICLVPGTSLDATLSEDEATKILSALQASVSDTTLDT